MALLVDWFCFLLIFLGLCLFCAFSLVWLVVVWSLVACLCGVRLFGSGLFNAFCHFNLLAAALQTFFVFADQPMSGMSQQTDEIAA